MTDITGIENKISSGGKNWTRRLGAMKIHYAIYYALIGTYMRIRFRFKTKTFKPKSRTYLVLVNHTHDLDQFFLGAMFPKYIRFVATESVLRKPVWGKVISFLQNPICRKKGVSGEETARDIRENLLSGISVAMFPEGMQTINGRTGFISSRTAELIKSTNCALITCRIHGGYMLKPLWASSKRRGIAEGEMVREYTPEMLDKMTVEEIYEAIKRDLYVNAYDYQRKVMVPYPGENLASGLENALFMCPKCRSLDSLSSSGNSFSCSCGLHMTLNEYGFFEGENLPYDNVCDWDLWQRNELNKLADSLESKTGEYICLEQGINLALLNGKTDETVIENSCMTLYSDALVFDNGYDRISFKLSDITGVSNFRSSALIFSADNARYEARPGHGWAVFKYIALIRLLNGKKYL